MVEDQSLYHKPWNDQPKFVTSTLEHIGTNHTKYLYGEKKNLENYSKTCQKENPASCELNKQKSKQNGVKMKL